MPWLGLMGRLLTSWAGNCCSHSRINATPSLAFSRAHHAACSTDAHQLSSLPVRSPSGHRATGKNMCPLRGSTLTPQRSLAGSWFSVVGNSAFARGCAADSAHATLFESTVICEYLNERQDGASLYSADALSRERGVSTRLTMQRVSEIERLLP